MGQRTVERQTTRRIIALGFALLLVLMVLISVIGLNRMSAIIKELDTITSNHHLKSDIINAMHKIVSERSLYTYLMYLTDDPFKRDEIYIVYNALATEFVQLRETLQNMSSSEAEQIVMEDTFEQIRLVQPIQEDIVEKIMDDDLAGIKEEIILNEWPQEQHIYNRFNTLIAMEQASASDSLDNAYNEYQSALFLILGLNGVVLLAGVLIATVVIRRTDRIERALFKEKELARFTLEAMGDAVITTDMQHRILYLNPVAENLLGRPEPEIIGRQLDEIFELVTDDSMKIEFAKLHDGREPDSIEFKNAILKPWESGAQYLVEGLATITHNDSGRAIGIAIVIKDVSETRYLTEQLTWQATHDSLTGLVNRREFERTLKQLLDNSKTEGKTHAALYIDLDQFKIVNDTCGHAAGDKLLQQISALLQKETRSSDTLARLGGDEFGVLLEACPQPKAEQIAHHLLTVVQSFRFSWKNRFFKLGASIGVVAIDENSESIGQIMSAADAACYVAKDQGRNRVWAHTPDDREIAKRHGEMELTSRINSALEAGRFVVYKQRIQPVRKTKDKKLFYEVLVRMLDEDGNEMLPMSFIPAAERYGIMPNVDRFIINEALVKLASGEKPYRDIDLITINLSAQSLVDDHFLDFVIDKLDKSGVEPERVCFEITETTAIANWIRVTRFISMLRGMGCKFALDDFGTGMASFTYLRNLQVDFIKIDGSFVRNIDVDNINHAMVEAIHAIGRVMGIATIAEFIENDVVLEKLEKIGVDYAQGYSIHKPEPF